MQPEVLFKATPPEVFLATRSVVLNYTCESLGVNQLAVLHFDSSLHGGSVGASLLFSSLALRCI